MFIRTGTSLIHQLYFPNIDGDYVTRSDHTQPAPTDEALYACIRLSTCFVLQTNSQMSLFNSA
jgi:hypothetical protein